MTKTNRQVVYIQQPKGHITKDCFSIREGGLPEPSEGEVVIANRLMSLDPYMRMGMLGAQGQDNLNTVMVGRVVGTVAASRHPDFKEGDSVFAMGRWEQHTCLPGSELRHINVGNVGWAPYLGVLGFTGLTAWVGLRYYTDMKEGETLFVSAAAGAVGSAAGQIGKIHGLEVVGCAGGPEKTAYILDELGFDRAFDYQASKDLISDVGQYCPNGIDIDFENVGGAIFDAVFRHMNPGGRLAICGGISQYNLKEPEPAVPNLLDFITKRLTMQGFTVRNHTHEIEAYIEKATEWVQNGQLKGRETIVEGIENTPKAFLDLFDGKNIGKMMVRVDQ
jgi:NADPH-dependent curcumin reductase CurA